MKLLKTYALNCFSFYVLLSLVYSCSTEDGLYDTVQELDKPTVVTDSITTPIDSTGSHQGGTEHTPFHNILKAFPSATGGGALVSGGRAGKVIHVTNLNSEGPGSFREALLTKGARTVVFDVSGVIDLGGSGEMNDYNGSDIGLGPQHGNLTIAGQTAPEGGITITGGTIYFDTLENVIIRYIRSRPAEAVSGEITHGDAFIFWGCNDVILDHVSVSFGGDQAITFNANTTTMKRITVQRSLIADSYTGIILGSNSIKKYSEVDKVSFINNLVVDVPHRTPNVCGDGNFEVIGNVIYNWQWRAINVNGGKSKLNHIANYYKRGRTTEKNSVAYNSNKIQIPNNLTAPILFSTNNFYSGVLNGDEMDNSIIWTNFSGSTPMPDSYFTTTPFALIDASFELKSAKIFYNEVLNDVGANKYFDANGRVVNQSDSYDGLKINNVKNDISTTPKQYSNWIVDRFTINKRSTAYDTDLDGMPDVYELSHGFDPNDSTDGSEDANNDGYTNLEHFLNQVDTNN